MKHLFLFHIFFLFWNLFYESSVAQNPIIDTNKIQIYIDSCKCLQESEKELKCHNCIRLYIYQSLKTVKDKKVKKFLAESEIHTIRNIGNIYKSRLDLPNAIKYYQFSLKIAEIIDFKKGIAAANFNIGNIYLDLKDFKNSLNYFQKSLTVFESIGDKKGIGMSLNGIGSTYNELSEFEKALEYFPRSLKNLEAIKDTTQISTCLYNIAIAYEKLNDYANAMKYYRNGLMLSQKSNSYEDIARSLQGIGDVLVKTRKEKESVDYFKRAFEFSEESDYLEGEKLALLSLSNVYKNQGKYKDALNLYVQHILIVDSINGLQNQQEITKMEMQDNFDKKEAIAKTEHEKEIAVADADAKKQRVIIWSVVGGLLLVVMFTGFILRSLRITRKQKQIIEVQKTETEYQKQIIEEKNKDITDSINYAKRIQKSILPHRRDIWSAFSQSFVLFKPKDIVSGDFYFFHKTLEKDQFLIAAADCTGHGVPGAFMSLVGTERLTDAVQESFDTSKILSLLNKGIKSSLKQTENENSTRDGMDIAICSINTSNRIVRYAGAYRPLWIIRKGQLEVDEIKATKKAIGGFTEDEQHFDTHELHLQQGDTFYIFSDGYADMFGGNGKKLTTKKFKQILLEIQEKTMQEQCKYLEDFAENWKAGIEQLDDILVIGIRL